MPVVSGLSPQDRIPEGQIGSDFSTDFLLWVKIMIKLNEDWTRIDKMVVRDWTRLASILVFLPGILSLLQNKENSTNDQVGISFILFDDGVQGKYDITTRNSTIATYLYPSPCSTGRMWRVWRSWLLLCTWWLLQRDWHHQGKLFRAVSSQVLIL